MKMSIRNLVILMMAILCLCAAGCKKEPQNERTDLTHTALYLDGKLIDEELVTIEPYVPTGELTAMIPLLKVLQAYGADITWNKDGTASIKLDYWRYIAKATFDLVLDPERLSLCDNSAEEKRGELIEIYPGDTKEWLQIRSVERDILICSKYTTGLLHLLKIDVIVQLDNDENAVYLITRTQ